MRKLLLFLLLIAVAGFLWFLFIKKYDYEFTMQAKYGPGAVYREITDWKNFQENKSDTIQIKDSIQFQQLVQVYKNGSGKNLEMLWELERENDTLTDIKVKVRVPDDKLKNRLAIINPFQTSIYVDSLKNKLLTFKKGLSKKQETYRIHIIDSIVKSPAMDCICHSSENVGLKTKAFKMIETIGYLQDYVLANDLKLSGSPFIKVTRWDRENDLVNFDFCFPVNLVESLQETKDVQFKKISSSSSIQAVFNGNYRDSHLAWYDLLQEAKKRGLRYSALPLEVFHDNPQSGTDAITWKADIYMPVLSEETP